MSVAEQYANVNTSLGQGQTTLSGNGGSITSGATSLKVAAATGFPSAAQYRILIDNELLIVTGGAGTTTWTVTRGAEGTTAATHNDGATVTHILTRDGLKGLSGSLILSDTYANLPAAGTVGHMYLPSDGFSLLRDNGSAWIPWGPINELTQTPAAASLTSVNVTTAVISDTVGGLYVSAPSIGSSHGQFWVKSLAAGAYTWIARLDPILLNTTFVAGGLALRDSAGGKIITFEQNVFSSAISLAVVQWTDANTRSVNAFTNGFFGSTFPWMKIHDDNTNRTYSVSRDGVDWYDVLTEGRTTFLGVAPNQAGIFVCANGLASALTVYSWNGV